MRVRDYFGEKIGFYFEYLNHYIRYLGVPAVLGIVVFFINIFLENTTAAARALNIIFAVLIVVWSSVMFEMWKRRQFKLSFIWGQTNYEEESVERV